jgi:hypothetical protein
MTNPKNCEREICMKKIKYELIIIWIIAIALVIGAIIHFLIIFDIIYEKNPPVIELFFDSLAVINILAAISLVLKKSWGRKLAILIFLFQLPSHGYMFYLEESSNYVSGFSRTARTVDVLLCFLFLLALNNKKIKKIFCN